MLIFSAFYKKENLKNLEPIQQHTQNVSKSFKKRVFLENSFKTESNFIGGTKNSNTYIKIKWYKHFINEQFSFSPKNRNSFVNH